MATEQHLPDPPAAELSRAGAVIDKAIEYMARQSIDEVAMASALLGGALALLAHSMADEAIVGILKNAIASVRAGELHRDAHGGPEAGPN